MKTSERPFDSSPPVNRLEHLKTVFSQFKENIAKHNREFRKEISKLDFRFSNKCIKPVYKRTDELECPICSFLFNSNEEKPLLLPCGHTVCRKCIKKEFSALGRTKCPFDRQEYSANINSFSVVFSLISLAENAQNNLICERDDYPLTHYCRGDHSFLCGHCISEHFSHDLIKLDEGILPELKEWQQNTQETTDQLKELRKTVYCLIAKSRKTEEQVVEALETHAAKLRSELKTVLADLEVKIEAHISEASRIMQEIKLNSSSNALEEAYYKLDNEINKSDEYFREFESLPLKEKLEKYREGTVKVSELSTPDLAPYYQLKDTINEATDYRTLIYGMLNALTK